jgi:hypothetical protein
MQVLTGRTGLPIDDAIRLSFDGKVIPLAGHAGSGLTA